MSLKPLKPLTLLILCLNLLLTPISFTLAQPTDPPTCDFAGCTGYTGDSSELSLDRILDYAQNGGDTDQLILDALTEAQKDQVTNAAEGRGPTGGLVPCSGLDCNMCSAVSFIDAIVKWIIGIMMVIFAIIVAYAGFKLVTSGGNPEAKTSAKKMFTNTIIGLLIVLSAWILVDTLLRALLPGEAGELNGGPFWSEIQCATQVSTVTSLPEGNVSFVDRNRENRPTEFVSTFDPGVPGSVSNPTGPPTDVIQSSDPDVIAITPGTWNHTSSGGDVFEYSGVSADNLTQEVNGETLRGLLLQNNTTDNNPALFLTVQGNGQPLDLFDSIEIAGETYYSADAFQYNSGGDYGDGDTYTSWLWVPSATTISAFNTGQELTILVDPENPSNPPRPENLISIGVGEWESNGWNMYGAFNSVLVDTVAGVELRNITVQENANSGQTILVIDLLGNDHPRDLFSGIEIDGVTYQTDDTSLFFTNSRQYTNTGEEYTRWQWPASDETFELFRNSSDVTLEVIFDNQGTQVDADNSNSNSNLNPDIVTTNPQDTNSSQNNIYSGSVVGEQIGTNFIGYRKNQNVGQITGGGQIQGNEIILLDQYIDDSGTPQNLRLWVSGEHDETLFDSLTINGVNLPMEAALQANPSGLQTWYSWNDSPDYQIDISQIDLLGQTDIQVSASELNSQP